MDHFGTSGVWKWYFLARPTWGPTISIISDKMCEVKAFEGDMVIAVIVTMFYHMHCHLVHCGACLKGGFSRIEYQERPNIIGA